jgi:hypothetical protein
MSTEDISENFSESHHCKNLKSQVNLCSPVSSLYSSRIKLISVHLSAPYIYPLTWDFRFLLWWDSLKFSEISSVLIKINSYKYLCFTPPLLIELPRLTPESKRPSGITKPGKVGNFFALVSMKSPNFCQKAKF